MMIPSDYIIEVTEAEFDIQVLSYSQQTPVVVDFWAEWCAPCRVLGPILEKLANEAKGGFRLAKVNVDQNPKLALRYEIRGIPAVKTFKNGIIVSEFYGALPEDKVREFMREFMPNPSDLQLEKANSLYQMGQFDDAEETYREVLEQSPESEAALLGLAKSLLRQGQSQEALSILTNFPISRELSSAQLLLPLARALDQMGTTAPYSDNPLDAAFHNSIRLVKFGNIEAAMDGLLDILRQDKNYQEGEARRIMLALLELMDEHNPITRQYRNELASILF